MLIDITTSGINYHLERNYDILLKAPKEQIRSWDVCNFPLRHGRWHREIAGLGGTIFNGSITYRRSLITADFLSCPGLRLKTLPVQCFLWLREWFRMIGKGAMDTARYSWRRWWTAGDSEGLVIRQLTGSMWGRAQAEDEWIGSINGKAYPRKRFICTPLQLDFDKSWWLYRGVRVWDRELLQKPGNLMRGSNSGR
jgi:hypothetical protein